MKISPSSAFHIGLFGFWLSCFISIASFARFCVPGTNINECIYMAMLSIAGMTAGMGIIVIYNCAFESRQVASRLDSIRRAQKHRERAERRKAKEEEMRANLAAKTPPTQPKGKLQ